MLFIIKPIYSLLLIFCGWVIINAQKTYTVQGTVQDFNDKRLIENTVVKIGEFITKTDERGWFYFEKIPLGKYVLIAEHPDGHDYTENIRIDGDLRLTLILENHTNSIESVTLHASYKAKSSLTMKTLDKTEIERNSTENLGNILSNISGVAALKTGNNITKPFIHGMYGSRVSIMNNGVKLAEQEWGVEHAPNVDINDFEHIDIIKGASALKYGNDGVAGVVLLESAIPPKQDTLMGNLKFSGISNGRGGELAASIIKTWENKWFLKAGGSYKKLGDIYIPHHTLQNTGTEINSFNFSLGNHGPKQGFDFSYNTLTRGFGIFKGSHLGNDRDIYNAMNLGQPYFLDKFSHNITYPKQNIEHHLAKISAYKWFAGFGKIAFQYSFQLNRRKEYDIRKGDMKDTPSIDLRLITHSVNLAHFVEHSFWSLESGISAIFQNNYPNPATQVRSLIPNYYRYDAGAFSVFKYRITKKLNAEAGVRYDFNRYDAYKYYDTQEWKEKYKHIFPQFYIQEYGSRILSHPILDYHNFSANVGLHYKPEKDFELQFNLSAMSRTPNAAELFSEGVHHSAAIIEKGDIRIKKENIYNANLSLVARFHVLKGLQIEANPYIIFSDSFINQIPVDFQNTNSGSFAVWAYQQVKSRIYGIDADAQLNIWDNLKWTTNFSALRGDDLTHNEPLILMTPINLRNSLELKLKSVSHFYIRLENENVFRQSRFPIRDQIVQFIENGALVNKIIDYSTPPPAFTIFHASVGANLFKNMKLNFRINNIFNKEYREYLNRLRYYMPEPGRNFVVTFKYNF